jgi:hypothetical protein
MFQFAAFALPALYIQAGVTLRWGCPIRRSEDHSLVTGSSRLIAGSYVLHRLSMPRHPSCALSGLAMPTWPPPPDPFGCLREGWTCHVGFACTNGHARVRLLTRAGSSMILEIVLGSYIAMQSSAVRRTPAELASGDGPRLATIASLVKDPNLREQVRDRKWYRSSPYRQGGWGAYPHRFL